MAVANILLIVMILLKRVTHSIKKINSHSYIEIAENGIYKQHCYEPFGELVTNLDPNIYERYIFSCFMI
jgi:hypothetical protein